MPDRYVATALGGALRQVLTEAEAMELIEATEPDLREDDPVTGVITLWARAVDHPGRLAPLFLRPLNEAA